jgi:hypothetical protein
MRIIFDHLHGHVQNDRVFCEAFAIPEGEKEHELLELGFLPNLQPPLYWYQSKSCRINNDKIVLSYKRKKILSQLKISIFNYIDKKTEVDLFFTNYFKKKNFDLFDSYNNNSSFDDLKIMEVKFDNEVVAYGKTQGKNYLYIYESYKDYFPYKLEITGVEYWEGEKWITP